MVEISVVVVTINDPEDIACVSRFEQSDFEEYELIIRGDEGIAAARNAGVREASTDKIVFIDDDAVPQPGYLRTAASVLDRENAVAGRVVDPTEGVLSNLSRHYPDGSEGKYIDYVIGCNMAFRREVFDQVGYFDEEFKIGHEETEFANRILHQYPIYYTPDMAVVHRYAEGIMDYWAKRYSHGPASVHYARKQGRSDREIIKSFAHPRWYYRQTPTVFPITLPGGIAENLSQLRTLLF